MHASSLHEFASPSDLLSGRFNNNNETAKLRGLMDDFQQGTVHIVQWKIPKVLTDKNQFASIVRLLNATTSRNDGSRTAHVFNQGLHAGPSVDGPFSLFAKRFQVLADIVNTRGDIAAWRETFPQHFPGSDTSGMYERRFHQMQQWGVAVSPNATPCASVDSMCTCDVQRAAGDHQSFDEALAREMMTTARFIPMFDLLHARGDLHFTRRFLKGGNLHEPDCTHYCRSPLLLDAIVRRTVSVLIVD